MLLRLGIGVFSGGDVGESCFGADDCRSGVCLQSGVVGGSCAERCSSDVECGADYVCRSVAGGRYCAPAPSREFGETCSSGQECTTELCLSMLALSDSAYGRCSQSCEGLTGCPEGALCMPSAEGLVCLQRSWISPRAPSAPVTPESSPEPEAVTPPEPASESEPAEVLESASGFEPSTGASAETEAR